LKSRDSVEETLRELTAAAMCYGAVTSPAYKVPKKRGVVIDHHKRLVRAAKKFHEVAVAQTVLASLRQRSL
jgi:hypothetical protein